MGALGVIMTSPLAGRECGSRAADVQNLIGNRTMEAPHWAGVLRPGPVSRRTSRLLQKRHFTFQSNVDPALWARL